MNKLYLLIPIYLVFGSIYAYKMGYFYHAGVSQHQPISAVDQIESIEWVSHNAVDLVTICIKGRRAVDDKSSFFSYNLPDQISKIDGKRLPGRFPKVRFAYKYVVAGCPNVLTEERVFPQVKIARKYDHLELTENDFNDGTGVGNYILSFMRFGENSFIEIYARDANPTETIYRLAASSSWNAPEESFNVLLILRFLVDVLTFPVQFFLWLSAN